MDHEYVRRVVEEYEFETDEELKRKREVIRSAIVQLTRQKIAEDLSDLETMQAAYDQLSRHIRNRERRRQKSESRKTWFMWAGFAGPFIIGVVSGEVGKALWKLAVG